MFSNFSSPYLLLIIHFIVSAILGFIAKKYLDRGFCLWFGVGFLVPVLSIIILAIVGYDGIYCPKCLKKIRKNYKICPHCGFDIEKYFEISKLNNLKHLDQNKK